MNKVILIGRLGENPEIKYSASGVAVCTLSIATNTQYKEADGKMIEEVEWSRVVLWRKMAENAGKYLKKGMRVYIEGKLKTDAWEKDGVKHYSTKIVADEMQFMESAKGEKAPDIQDNEVPMTNPAGESDDIPF